MGILSAVFQAVVGFIASGLTAVGVNATVATAAANIIVGAGLTVLSGAFRRRPRLSMPDQQSVINQSTGPRIRGYGRDKLGGTRAFWDSKDGTLYQVVMHHSGLVDQIESVWLGDRTYSLSGNGWVTGDDAIPDETIRIRTLNGSPNQTAFGTMTAAWPGVWTDDHRLRGIACTYAEFEGVDAEDFAKVYPEGAQTSVRILARLSRVYDPRTGETAWSENAALCMLDYLRHADGFPGITTSDVDLASFASFANVCAAGVPLRAGGVQQRYRLGGTYSLQDDPVDVLQSMQATCDADLYLTPEGKIGVRGGVWQAPTVTITDRDILSFDLSEGTDKLAAFNELKIVFRDPSASYQPNEAPAWRNTADQATRGQIVEDLTLDMVQWPAQAQRLAKIHAHRMNPRWRGTISTNLVGLKAWGERFVNLVIPEMHIDGPFYIERRAFRTDMSGLEFEVYSLGPEAYAWTTAEEGVPSPPPAGTKPSRTIEVPVVSEITTPLRTIGSTTGYVIQLTVVEPTRTGLSLVAQFRLSPAGPWEAMSAVDLTAVSGIVSEGETYEVRARWKTSSSVVSAWLEPPETVEV